jgi:hypothetical protein
MRSGVVIIIRAPLPDIAAHIVESIGVWFEQSDLLCPATAHHIPVAVPRSIPSDLIEVVAPRVAMLSLSARSPLPLILKRESIAIRSLDQLTLISLNSVRRRQP